LLILTVVALVLAGSVSALAADDQDSKDKQDWGDGLEKEVGKIEETSTPWQPIVYSLAGAVGIVGIAFKNSKRTHLD